MNGCPGESDVRLTEIFSCVCHLFPSMNDGLLDMDEVTIELTEEELEAIEEIAFKEHRENRAAAIRGLLDEWLKERND